MPIDKRFPNSDLNSSTIQIVKRILKWLAKNEWLATNVSLIISEFPWQLEANRKLDFGVLKTETEIDLKSNFWVWKWWQSEQISYFLIMRQETTTIKYKNIEDEILNMIYEAKRS